MQDIILDNNRDIDFANGDIRIDTSDDQHTQLLLLTAPGEWKQHPTHGVGVIQYVENHDNGALARRIHSELTADGMRVDNISINNSNINIQATYDNN